MSVSARPFAHLRWDGAELSAGEDGPGRRFGIDARCLAGEPVAGAWAQVCASPDPEAKLLFDAPEVQQARREALAWWFSMLGDDLVCVSTLSLDASYYGGAITVARTPERFPADPFARLFGGTVVRTSLFAAVDPPPGPVMERYSGAPWPAGGFAA